MDERRLFRFYSIDNAMQQSRRRKFHVIRMVEMFIQSVLCLHIMDRVVTSFIDQFSSDVNECLNEGEEDRMLDIGPKCLQDLKSFIENIFTILFDSLYEDCKMVALRYDFEPECTSTLSNQKRTRKGNMKATDGDNDSSSTLTTFDEFLRMEISEYDELKLQSILDEMDRVRNDIDDEDEDDGVNDDVDHDNELMRMDDETLNRALEENRDLSNHVYDIHRTATNAHLKKPIYYQDEVNFLRSDKSGEFDRDDWVKNSAEDELKAMVKIAVRRQIEMEAFLGK